MQSNIFFKKTLGQTLVKGAFTLAQFHGQFCTKLAHLVIKTKMFFSKTCKLNVKSHAKFANVNAPLNYKTWAELSTKRHVES